MFNLKHLKMDELEDGNDLPGADDPIEETSEEENPYEEFWDDDEDDVVDSDDEVVDDTPTEEEPSEDEDPEPAEEEPAEEPETTEEATEEVEEEPAPNAEETEEPEAEEEEAPKPQPTVDELKTQYAENRKTHVEALSKLFAVESEEDMEALRLEPEKKIPEMLGNLAYEVHEMSVRSMMQLFPSLVQQYNALAMQQQQEQQAFFDKWEVLKDPKYHQDVERARQLYKQMNPTASVEQMINEVGATVLIKHKIPFDIRTGKLLVDQEEPAPAPVRPPRGGAAGGSAPTMTVWDEMAQDDD